MRVGEAPEISLAAKAGPLGEDRQGENLRVGEKDGATGLAWDRGMACPPPVVHGDVQ